MNSAISTALTPYLTTSTANTTYLKLSGGQLTGNLGFGIAPTTSIYINCSNSSSTAFQNIQMMNNIGDFFYFGIAGNAVSNGSYLNNFFIQSSKGLVFNSMNKTHTGTPDMIITGGSVGINTTAPNTTYKLDVNGGINATTLYEGNVSLTSKYLQSASLANYVLKAGDTMSGALTVNGNINITSSGTNSLIFDDSYNLKKIQLNSTNGLGSDGSSTYFYTAGTFTFKNGNTTVYSVDAAGSMSTNGTIYPAGGLYSTGTLTGNSVVANSFTEGGVLLSNKYITSAALDTTYLRLNGANDMTGKLGIINSGLTTPQLGFYGGIGDRLILWKGDAGAYPYSLGMNGITMWYSVPNGAIHNFYVNGTSRYQINSSGATVSGALNITGNTTTATLNVTGITTIATNNWITSSDTILRIYFANNDATLFQSPNGYNFRKTDGNSLLLINNNGTTGIGTNASSASLSLYSTTQLQPRLILSGQEFYVPFNGTVQNSSAEGIAFLCGVNRNGNRQLWIGDSANLTQNATNSVLRLTNLGYIDCIGTDGLTRKPLSIGGNLNLGANGVNIGMNTSSYKSTATVLTIAGGSSGYSQPLVQITQNNGWDGNYALQVKGYANIGGDSSGTGLRINGEDTGNTIFQNGNNPIGITVNNSWIAFNTNGGERMRLAANGEIFFVNNVWQRSYDNVYRMYYETNGRTYFSSGGNLGFTFRSTDQLLDVLKIENNGNIRAARSVYCDGNYGYFLNINANNYWNIYTGTTNGVANSLTFFHGATGISSYWYLNGTQNGTMSEISDKRSKYNIQDFSALETIKKLKPKSFDVIDDKDIRFQYGFIAQDIEEIDELKKLVFTQNDYIANVNTYGRLGEENIIKADDDLTGKIEIGDEIKLVCDNNNKENQEFILDSTPYHNRYKRRYAKITEIISPTEFKVDCEINKFSDNEFLIYGKKVEDAKSLDYNSFIALNTKAIQELYDIIQRQQQQINLLLSYRNGN